MARSGAAAGRPCDTFPRWGRGRRASRRGRERADSPPARRPWTRRESVRGCGSDGRGRRADRRRGWPTGSGWGTGWPSGPSGGPTARRRMGRPFAEGGRGCRRGGFPTFFPTLFPTLFPTRRPLPSLSRPRSAPSKPFPLPNFSNVFFQLDSWKKLENRGGIGRKTGFDREAGITKKPRFSGAKRMG